MAGLDEDAVDELLYLARTNETVELEAFLSQLSTQTQRPTSELVAAAVDPCSNNTTLHYAAANGHNSTISNINFEALIDVRIDIIKLLCSIAASALINAINESGNTPLHWAALNGHLESVKLLLQAGADMAILNRAGHDAVFEAEINDKKDVVDWLLGAVDELEKGIDGAIDSSPAEKDKNGLTSEKKESGLADHTDTPGGQSDEPFAEVIAQQLNEMQPSDSA